MSQDAFGNYVAEMPSLGEYYTRPECGTGGGASEGVMQSVPPYDVDPTAEGLVPADQNAPAMTYQKDGAGPTFSWNVTTHVWQTILLLIALALMVTKVNAANVSFSDFKPTDLTTNGNKVGLNTNFVKSLATNVAAQNISTNIIQSIVTNTIVNGVGHLVKQGTNTLMTTNAGVVTVNSLTDTNIVRSMATNVVLENATPGGGPSAYNALQLSTNQTSGQLDIKAGARQTNGTFINSLLVNSNAAGASIHDSNIVQVATSTNRAVFAIGADSKVYVNTTNRVNHLVLGNDSWDVGVMRQDSSHVGFRGEDGVLDGATMSQLNAWGPSTVSNTLDVSGATTLYSTLGVSGAETVGGAFMVTNYQATFGTNAVDATNAFKVALPGNSLAFGIVGRTAGIGTNYNNMVVQGSQGWTNSAPIFGNKLYSGLETIAGRWVQSGDTWGIGFSDAAIHRAAAGVVAFTDGIGAQFSGATRKWFQWGGEAHLATNMTTTGTTLAAIGFNSAAPSLAAGRSYEFTFIMFCSDALAADGVKVDFGGGTCTATTFRAHTTTFGTALAFGGQQTSLTGAQGGALLSTDDEMVEVHGFIKCNAAGTFLPRFAKNTDTAGSTLTIYAGSNLICHDVP